MGECKIIESRESECESIDRYVLRQEDEEGSAKPTQVKEDGVIRWEDSLRMSRLHNL